MIVLAGGTILLNPFSTVLFLDELYIYINNIAPIAQSVSALDFNSKRAVEGSILTAGKRLRLKI